MERSLGEVLRTGRGIVSAWEVGNWTLGNAVRSGRLTRLFPETYVDSGLLNRLSAHGRFHLRCRAALHHTRHQGAISHTAALALWDLLAAPPKIHVTLNSLTRQRTSAGIVIHHHRGFSVPKTRRGGLAVTSAAESVVRSWPLLGDQARIGAAVRAVELRLTTVAELRSRLNAVPKLPGRGKLAKLLRLMERGCRSPLEVWGAADVFDGPEFARLRRQFPVRVAGRLFYLDLFAETEKVNFELDGAAFHGDSVQRERDLKRDALLATLGIVVVRFTYARLMSEPETVRREALLVLAARS